MKKWVPVSLSSKLLQNVKEAVLSKSAAAYENLFINDTGGQSRFPGLKPFVSLIGRSPTYLHEWRGDLAAVTTGRLFLINQNGTAADKTKAQISGDQRVVFDRSPNELIMAAGGDVIRFAGVETEVLDTSGNLPKCTHCMYIDAFLVACERYSGRFFNSNANDFRNWPPINVFAANSKPDDINAMLVTPFRELLLSGLDSVEQFERLSSGASPFYRRWAVGEGVRAPYTLTFEDNAAWFINKRYELVRLSGQTTLSKGDDVERILEGVDNWDQAWMTGVTLVGQKFLLLQIPKATNVYGTKGITILFDYRQNRFYNLYGWDVANTIQTRWPGWSYYPLWGRWFVGGDGAVLELDPLTFTNNGQVQKVHMRTAHMKDWGEARVDNVRLTVKRGGSSNYNASVEPKVGLRCIKDASKPTRWRYKGLGMPGQASQQIEFGPMGTAHSWQFEIDMTDASEYEVIKLDAQPERVGF